MSDTSGGTRAAAVVDVAVIGGGAAGLMAAIWSARRGARTLLLEGAKACGLKILVSGGGRCNVLPSEADDRDFFTSGSRNVLRRLFRTWPLADVRRFFEEDLGLPLHVEKETGKLFPVAEEARPVRDRLVGAIVAAGGQIRTHARVTGISPTAGGFAMGIAGHAAPVQASRVILTTGGMSLPRTGSDGAGYEFARALGHEILPAYPALVPLTTDDTDLCALAGIALPVRWRVRQGGAVLEERVRELLFTHRGFSGPAILDASHWAVRDGAAIEVAWGAYTAADWDATLVAFSRRTVENALAEKLPRRLVEILVRRAGVDGATQVAQLRRDLRTRLMDALCSFPLPVNGNEGYRVAEVTGGGIPLAAADPSTLESRTTPGLFIAGEIFDVIGRIGGYNFLWAWITGRLTGESAAFTIPK